MFVLNTNSWALSLADTFFHILLLSSKSSWYFTTAVVSNQNKNGLSVSVVLRNLYGKKGCLQCIYLQLNILIILVIHQYIRANSLYVKTNLAITQILILNHINLADLQSSQDITA